MFPILNWNRWRGYCCPQSENIFRRRRDEKIMPNGKRTRLKKPHYNLIKNLNVKKFRWRQRNLAFQNNAEARQKVCRTFIKRQRQAEFSPVCLFFFRIYLIPLNKEIIRTISLSGKSSNYYNLAGVERFELPDDGVRVRCLTAWRHPNIWSRVAVD